MPRRSKGYITPVDEKAIGGRLRELRKRRGLTQTEVADQLGIGQTVVSHYERGSHRLHAAMVAAFAKVLRTSADEILGLKDVTTKNRVNGRLLRRLERIQDLSTADQRAVLKVLNALLLARNSKSR